ncbi:hypothetical protein [Amycolatopsis thermoflava]|uniref:Uncharacterized protein n=1 Tax=Amycolatopsis thermoflava TaxID=84480 RepID=A0A3N2GQD4_9PSEU|nr:hypothetical protein [Amycolatopsis thermoflava]ROS38831.1 hypothetical protein EDD35_1119 [Amycolatopsis thermoflava]
MPSGAPPRPGKRRLGIGVAAGVAAVVLVVGGVGGFAIGRATAGSDDGGRPGYGQFDRMPRGYGEPPGFGERGQYGRGSDNGGSNT